MDDRADIEQLVRTRLRTLRQTLGLSLDELADSAWLVDEIQGRPGAEGVRSTLGFQGMTVYGSAGCNRYVAKAGQREGVLELGAVATTRRMCEPPAMEQEQGYLAALDRVAHFRLAPGGDRLVAVNGKAIADLPPGDFATEMRRPVVVLTVDRDGKNLDVTLNRPE